MFKDMTEQESQALASEVAGVIESYLSAGHSATFVCDAVAVTALSVLSSVTNNSDSSREHLLSVIAAVGAH